MGPVDRLRVVIVDDDVEATRALRGVLARGVGVVHVAGEAADPRAGLRAVVEERPDVTLVAASMPALTISAILDRVPDARVLAVCGSGDREGLRRALRAGACGYVLRTAPVRDVVDGIRAAAERRALLSPRAPGTADPLALESLVNDARLQAAVFADDDPPAA